MTTPEFSDDADAAHTAYYAEVQRLAAQRDERQAALRNPFEIPDEPPPSLHTTRYSDHTAAHRARQRLAQATAESNAKKQSADIANDSYLRRNNQ